MFINIHTHSARKEPGTIAVQNIIIGQSEFKEQPGQLYSAGIHPWYTTSDQIEHQLQMLESYLQLPSVKIIGECGLDRLRGANLDTQQEILVRQFELAGKKGIPVLIHCVKAFNELIKIKKETKVDVALIVHGFNNNIGIAKQLLDQGFNLSFGAALLNDTSNAVSVIKSVPAHRLFLETDDKEVSISEIYARAATLRDICLNNLKDIIFANWMSLEIDGEL